MFTEEKTKMTEILNYGLAALKVKCYVIFKVIFMQHLCVFIVT